MKTQLQFLSNTFLSTVENWYFFFHRLGKNVVTKHSGGAKDISFQLDEKKKKKPKKLMMLYIAMYMLTMLSQQRRL